jgi:hypothetical protein
MRAAEWIQLVVFSYFIILAWLRTLPGNRRARVTALGAAGLAATLAGAWIVPRLVTPLAASVVRDWLPAALVLLVYRQAGEFFTRVDDKVQARLLRLDERIAAPLLRWLARHRAGGWVAAYFELAYLLCYPMIPMSLGALYVLRLARHADHFWTVVLISTYISYGMLPFIQTLPPRMLAETWLVPLPPNPVRNFNLWILRHASIHANTFPSAHVAASTAAALVLIALAPTGVGMLFGAIAIGIAFGTFIGRYHYAADAILGALVAAAVLLLAIGLADS